MENRREFWQRHWDNVQKPALSNGLMPRHPRYFKWGQGIEEKWEPMISEGRSPKELWESQYKRVSEINGKFDTENKPPVDENRWKHLKNSGEGKTMMEEVGLLFMKPGMQEMQEKWESEMSNGKTPEEFWKEEKQNLWSRRSYWGWGRRERRCHGHQRSKTGEDSDVFREFDFWGI